MSDVIGHEVITLRPGDSAVPYDFNAPACSSQNANDGAIPYGTDVSSVVVKGYKKGVESSNLIQASSESNNIIQVQLNYPTEGGGKYQLRFDLTLDTGAVLSKRFDEVHAKEDD